MRFESPRIHPQPSVHSGDKPPDDHPREPHLLWLEEIAVYRPGPELAALIQLRLTTR